MIKVFVDNGKVTIEHAEGTASVLVSELCSIVNAVCTAFSEDEEEREVVRKEMVLFVADILKMVEEKRGG